MTIYKQRKMTRAHMILGGSYLLPKHGKNRLKLNFILVMRTKGQNMGKNISRDVNIFTPHITG